MSDYPNDPAVNDHYTDDALLEWVCDSVAPPVWSRVPEFDQKPVSPLEGDEWYDKRRGKNYIWLVDGGGAAWVEFYAVDP